MPDNQMNASFTLKTMLERYELKTVQDYKNAIKEIIQEIALLGLWRGKFFEKAAFYGGTALRILYELDRFSEDLDFCLLQTDENFNLKNYESFVKEELKSYGFDANVEQKIKTKHSAVDSAFIKVNTMQHLIYIGSPAGLFKNIHPDELIKIRFEVDTTPPIDNITTVNKNLLLPSPFTIKTFRIEDLFAGKVHAALCRQWQGRVKGRDWYDLVWFISKNVSLNLNYLEKRMQQSGFWDKNKKLTSEILIELLDNKIDSLDIPSAKKDIIFYIRDSSKIQIWSHDFFKDIVRKIRFL